MIIHCIIYSDLFEEQLVQEVEGINERLETAYGTKKKKKSRHHHERTTRILYCSDVVGHCGAVWLVVE